MSRWLHIILLIITSILIFSPQVSGQFYYGHQMDFGKNRVQFNDFYWYFYRYEDFDTYFNQQGKNLANYTSDYLHKEISRIESFFDYELENRLIFIVYNKLTDFRQSNIGLVTGKDDYNTGGVTKIINNKVFIYFDGDHKKFEEQISAAITEVLINEMLYGNQLRENVTNSTLIELPDWYLKGLISYVSVNWDTQIEDEVKDGILNERYDKFNRLTGNDAVSAGHSFWRFIAENYGESVIPNIIYLTRINKNSNSGFLYVLGFNIKELSYEWEAYYRDIFDESKVAREFPESGKVFKKTNQKKVYNQLRISPDGKYIAYSTNQFGQYRIYLYDTDTDKNEKIIQREHRLDQIPDLTYPVLNWHPTGKILSFFTEEEGGIKLYYYILETEELTPRNMPFFEKILDFSYSDDGFKMVISGINRGQSDIYVHTLSSGTNQRITSDIYDDFNPRFVNGSTKIIFSSNRPADTTGYYKEGEALMSKNLTHDLYITDFTKRPFELRRVSNYEFVNDVKPIELGNNQFIFLSDHNGIINRHVARYDSAISFVDTTTHYRYFSNSYPVTNFSRNIRDFDINKRAGKVTDILYYNGRYNIYSSPLEIRSDKYFGDYSNTPFIEEKTKALAEADSLQKVRKDIIAIHDIEDNQIITDQADTIRLDRGVIDINNYIFEVEKLNYYNQKFNQDNINLVLDTTDFRRPTPRIYETAFYTNYLATQIDFSFLGASYQAFTGGAVYYNPGFNLMFKLGTNDLFEDYKLTAGVRFSADFDSNEYLLSYENLKRRLNKQFVFHRQVFKSFTQSQSSIVKSFSHNLMYILRWPFSQVGAFEGTVSGRQDKLVFLSTDLDNLNEENINYYWASVKLAYIFDNTRHLGINLYHGTRFKIFSEAYQQLNDKKYDLYTVGGDFRHYLKVHRTLIWANRFATGASFGRSRLIYYLGSVDNWTNFSTRVETFDQSIPIDYSKNYVYQTLATNMRGFTQNIRNGDRFAVYNSELRWPVIRYFANHPISSNFWNNLAFVGFFDVGTAWNGLHPWSGENAYDNEVIENGPLLVTIDSNREPVVYGYGLGVRSMLLGYFIRLDWAWGVENKVVLPRIFYLSLLLDF
ncbi:MAG: PD40 domain-containing protein [Bacteroidales bacterium]|nr:PD40 domain-containing protein [Bacteroidales bacterium]